MTRHRRHYRLPAEKAEKVILAAMKVSFRMWVDELDCKKSLARQPSHKTVADFFNLSKSGVKILWNCILREPVGDNPAYADIGGSTLINPGGPDYFLWVHVPIPEAEALIRKFKLQPHVV